MLILATNDDGYESKGLKALVRAVKSIKGVTVITVAPDREQSAKSHSLTLHRPLRIFKKAKDVFAVDGTPTDCVMIGCSKVLDQEPDLIISGINRGGNLGDDVHYSGTVSAAIEGGIMGIPAMAFSQLGREKFDYKIASEFAKKLVVTAKKNGLPAGVVLNVNVPEGAQNLEFEIVKTGKRNYGDICIERHDPRGRPYYWIGGNQYEFQDIKNSDCNAITANKISVTPLKVNLTDNAFMRKLKDWKW